MSPYIVIVDYNICILLILLYTQPNGDNFVFLPYEYLYI